MKDKIEAYSKDVAKIVSSTTEMEQRKAEMEQALGIEPEVAQQMTGVGDRLVLRQDRAALSRPSGTPLSRCPSCS